MSNLIQDNDSMTKRLVKMSIPLILTLLVYELYNMVDTYFVSHHVGDLGIAFIMVVFPIQRAIAAISAMLATGSSAAISRQMGRENERAAIRVIKQGYSLVLAVSIILIAILFLFSNQILYLFGASDKTLAGAKIYLHYISLGSFFVIGTNYMTRIMLSFGKSRLSFYSTALGAAINVVLDYILVAKLGYGIRGAGIATMTSQIISFIYSSYYFKNIKKRFTFKWDLFFNKNYALAILSVGIAALVVELEDGLVIGVLNNLLRSTMGDEGVIILGLITKIYMFLFITSFGISQAMQPMAAYEIGSGNKKKVKRLLKTTMVFSFLTTSLVWIATMIFTRQLMMIFLKTDHIIDQAVKAFRIVISVFPILSVYYTSVFYFQAKGEVKLGLVSSIMRQVLIMIPLAIILVKVFDLGALGVWISYPITDILASIISIYLLFKRA